MPVKIFCCYAHEDEALLNQLKRHLIPLQRQGLIDVWYDRDISAGTDWEQEIKDQLNSAQIILLLVSPDFMASDYCYGVEMRRALGRHEQKDARVIPVILRPVYWQIPSLQKLQALPSDAKPIVSSSWHYQDEAFFNVTEGIKKVVENLIKSHNVIVEPERFPQTSAKHQNLVVNHLTGAYKTDVGKQREQNEDSAFMRISDDGDRGLFIVADGMGNQAGEVASKLAVQKISEALKSLLVPVSEQTHIKLTPLFDQESIKLDPAQVPETPVTKNVEEQLKAAIRQANKAILNYGEEQSSARGLGCTVTSALIQNDMAFIANIGNSRTYLYRDSTLTPLTKDHSLAYRLVEAKQIEPDEIYSHPQRNSIYRSLGAGHKSVDPDVFHISLRSGDSLLLCSDGLWEMVRNQDLRKVLKENTDAQKICDILIDLANANGGEDNITAVLVQIH